MVGENLTIKRELRVLGFELYGLGFDNLSNCTSSSPSAPVEPSNPLYPAMTVMTPLFMYGNELISVDTAALSKLFSCSCRKRPSVYTVDLKQLITPRTIPIIGAALSGLTLVGLAGLMKLLGLTHRYYPDDVFIPIVRLSLYGSIGLLGVSMTVVYKALHDWTQPDLIQPLHDKIKASNNLELKTTWNKWHRKQRRSELVTNGSIYASLASAASLFGLMKAPFQFYELFDERGEPWMYAVNKVVKVTTQFAGPAVVVFGLLVGYTSYRLLRNEDNRQVNKFMTVVNTADRTLSDDCSTPL